jgi:hypothetical protein
MPDSGFEWVERVDIEDFVDGLIDETILTGYELARDGLARFQSNIEINTPVATSALRESYKQTDIDYVLAQHGVAAVYAWEGTVFTEIAYAEHVEYGTGLWGPKHAKYKIEPKTPGGVLKFAPYSRGANGAVILDVQNGVVKGGPVFARYVMHPGSPGAAMFRIGATLTEHQVNEWSAQAMLRWRAKAGIK